MYSFSLIIALLLLEPVFSRIVSQPLNGQHEDSVTIQDVEIEETEGGGRGVTVYFAASNMPQILWDVGGRPVLYYDTNFVTMSSYNTATLRMGPGSTDQKVKVTIILNVYQESVLIRLTAAPGWYVVSNHTLTVSPGESLTYTGGDTENVQIDAALWVHDTSNYQRLRLDSMLVIPDYCTRPIKPVLGFTSSNPDMLQIQTANENDDFAGLTNWRSVFPASKSVTKNIRITSVSRSSQKQGMLVVKSQFNANSQSSPVVGIRTVRRIFFKPAPMFTDFIMRNTVTFIGWKHDLVVDQYHDGDFHVFAVGNPVPRIMLARNGRDVSTMVERRDIAEAYFKHSIFRFRNVTEGNFGRYICTAVSGDGRIKETFTLYVRVPCNSSK